MGIDRMRRNPTALRCARSAYAACRRLRRRRINYVRLLLTGCRRFVSSHGKASFGQSVEARPGIDVLKPSVLDRQLEPVSEIVNVYAVLEGICLNRHDMKDMTGPHAGRTSDDCVKDSLRRVLW